MEKNKISYNKSEYISNKIKNHYNQQSKIKKVREEFDKKTNKILNSIEESSNEYDKDEYIKEKIQSAYKKNYVLAKNLIYYQKLKKSDKIYVILNNLANRVNKELKKYEIKRSMTHIELIGCTVDELKCFLELKFTDFMTFENYGEWEIDHIKPISKFDLSILEEMKKCFHFKNLQPLWKPDNRSKGNKYIEEDVSEENKYFTFCL